MIYFIQAGDHTGPIKIGHVRDLGSVNQRRAQLQIGCPENLGVLAVLPGSLADERALHEGLAEHRIRGEWFRAHQDVRDVIGTGGADILRDSLGWRWQDSGVLALGREDLVLTDVGIDYLCGLEAAVLDAADGDPEKILRWAQARHATVM